MDFDMMNTTPTFLGIIPARGGSKGIPGKNTRLFCGEPLISHTIREAKKSRKLSRIIVSTESEEIAKLAKEFGAEVPFLRPLELAQDTSKVFDAVAHSLKLLQEREGYAPNYVVLLQPTSPLRTAQDIDATIELLLKEQADSAITVSRVEPRVFVHSPEGALTLTTSPAFLASTNRQELAHTVAENGSMVYVSRVSTLLASGNFLGGKLVGVEVPRWRSVDLDSPEDFILGELICKHREEIERDITAFQ
ncbi:MAG: acylneuraminate cytidylyltransferase family protein [Candidatus Taylorbacteria bacterium]|nr:acylneuraminate cytidylyltransferase family protein [Candidatus Taylorbacteria bacterium]